jgi:hypothetical protein
MLPTLPGRTPFNPSKLPGCTDQDPRSVISGAAGDLHLASDSPRIDAGRNDFAASLALVDPAPDIGTGLAPLLEMRAHERGAQTFVPLVLLP